MDPIPMPPNWSTMSSGGEGDGLSIAKVQNHAIKQKWLGVWKKYYLSFLFLKNMIKGKYLLWEKVYDFPNDFSFSGSRSSRPKSYGSGSIKHAHCTMQGFY